MLAATGLVVRVEEKDLDAVTAISGSGPAYAFYLIDAMAEAGVLLGLSRDVATRLAVATVEGSAALAAQSGDHPAVLRERVSSPGGTTVAAVQVLDAHGVRAGIVAAARGGAEPVAELGRAVLLSLPRPGCMSTLAGGSTDAGRAAAGRRPARRRRHAGTILAAARDEFAERGYDGASIRSRRASRGRRPRTRPALLRRTRRSCSPRGWSRASVDPASSSCGDRRRRLDGLAERRRAHALGGRRRRAAFRVAFAGLSSSEVHAEAAARVRRARGVRRDRAAAARPEPELRVSLVVSHIAGVLLVAQRHAPRADRVAADPAGGRAGGADPAALPDGYL